MDNEKSNQSIVNFAFVVCGFMAFGITSVLLDVLAGTFGAVARVRSIELVQHGLPVTVGLITFLVLFMNKKIYLWADESVTEVRRVVWPTKKDVTHMTMACCFMVVAAGAVFSVFDFFSSQLIKFFVN